MLLNVEKLLIFAGPGNFAGFELGVLWVLLLIRVPFGVPFVRVPYDFREPRNGP